MCPGSTVRGQYPSPVPHRSPAGGTGDSSDGTLHPSPEGPLPSPSEAQACPHHGGTGHVIYREPSMALNVSVAGFQELPPWDTGGVPVLTWSQTLQVTTATMVTAKLQ